MSKKILLITFSTLLILTSCFSGKNDWIQINSLSNTGVKLNNTDSLSSEEQQEKRKESILKNMKSEDKQIFLDLDQARIGKDTKKVIELEKQIKTLEEAKRKELDEAVKNWDDKKAFISSTSSLLAEPLATSGWLVTTTNK